MNAIKGKLYKIDPFESIEPDFNSFDREYMGLHLESESSSPQHAKWWIRERAADGLNTHAVPAGFYSRNLVGYLPQERQIDQRCLVHHMSNR